LVNTTGASSKSESDARAEEEGEEEEEEESDVDSDIEDIECIVCNSKEHAKSMLLCDGCDDGFHMSCLDPPLHSVPEGDWYCAGVIY